MGRYFSFVFVLMMNCTLYGCDSEVTRRSAAVNVPAQFDVDGIAQAVASAYCQGFARCKVDIQSSFILFADHCSNELASALKDDLARAQVAVDAGRIVYSANAMRDCVEAITNSSCTRLDRQDFEEVCARPLRGVVGLGSPCSLDDECEAGYCPGEDGCDNRCEPLSELGGDCSAEGERQCAAGLDCGPDDTCVSKSQVALRAGLNQPCDLVKCRPGLFCGAGTRRICVPFGQAFSAMEGDACSIDSSDGTIERCDAGLICSIISPDSESSRGQCVRRPGEGEACSPAAIGPEFWCRTGLYCAGLGELEVGDSGSCTALPDHGEACGLHFGAPRFCRLGLRCDGGQCKRLESAGRICDSDEACAEGRCIDGLCTLQCVDSEI